MWVHSKALPVIASGLNYIGMKEQNFYKDTERYNIIFKKQTFIYPVGGRKGDDHIIITLSVADRMTTRNSMVSIPSHGEGKPAQ